MVTTKKAIATESLTKFNGIKVFSATMHRDRDELGERVTAWIKANPTFEIVEFVQTQSSDQSFHCITISLFFNDPSVEGSLVKSIARPSSTSDTSPGSNARRLNVGSKS